MKFTILFPAIMGYLIGSIPFNRIFKDDIGILALGLLLVLEASKGFIGILLLGLMGVYIGFIASFFMILGVTVPIIKNKYMYPAIDCAITIGIMSYSLSMIIPFYAITYCILYILIKNSMISTIISMVFSYILICNICIIDIQYSIMLALICIVQIVALCARHGLFSNTRNDVVKFDI